MLERQTRLASSVRDGGKKVFGSQFSAHAFIKLFSPAPPPGVSLPPLLLGAKGVSCLKKAEEFMTYLRPSSSSVATSIRGRTQEVQSTVGR